MITILFSLLVGWLLHFVHLNGLFTYLVGMNDHGYYFMWLIMGLVAWMRGLLD
jgi:uncharacterized membrane protein YiaA